MGKNKIVMQQKGSKSERLMTYSKRSKGLLKKAYEISTLCDVEVALIMFSPNEVLRQFSTEPRYVPFISIFWSSLIFISLFVFSETLTLRWCNITIFVFVSVQARENTSAVRSEHSWHAGGREGKVWVSISNPTC